MTPQRNGAKQNVLGPLSKEEDSFGSWRGRAVWELRNAAQNNDHLKQAKRDGQPRRV